jgi:glycosyltransferase involved in cell wall biosynthesis
VTDYVAIIPTRNRYEDCLRATRSVLAQSVPPAEVIVVNDASTDPRYEWLQEIVNDARVVVLTSEVGSQAETGHGFAVGTVRNRGLAYVRRAMFEGWVAFLDDDDEWITDKMEAQFRAAGEYKNVLLFCANAYNRSPSGLISGYHHGDHGRVVSSRIHDVTDCLREFNPVINSTAMIRADLASRLGPQQAFGYGEDFDYWRRAAGYTSVLRIDEPLAFYTVNNPKEYRL